MDPDHGRLMLTLFPANPVRQRRWVFLAFLFALHLVFVQGPLSQFGRVFFLIHIGVGLLWQPFIQSKRRLGFPGTMLVVVVSGLFAYYLNWGTLILWTMLLTGVVGGKIFLFPDRWERSFHLLGLGYLAMATFALLLPEFLGGPNLIDPILRRWLLYLAPVAFVAMALLPVSHQLHPAEHAEIVDFVYGVMVFLLQAVIVLGSISLGFLFKVGYFESLLLTLALVAAVLLSLGLIWHPSLGFGGLGGAFAQHVMSLGLPLEGWLQLLARLGDREADALKFLESACMEIPGRLPGVLGVSWQAQNRQGAIAETEGWRVPFVYGEVEIELITRASPSPTLLWHYDMTCRLLAEVYLGKWRSEELRRLSYIEAIHETGARLTHDVKNLLQTLDTLCMAAEREGKSPTPRFIELLQRQLPEIASRLRQTLVKLSSPDSAETTKQPMRADLWLAGLRNRMAGGKVSFITDGDLSAVLIDDPTLFSSIAENLLQNISDKQRLFPGLSVTVRLCAPEGRPVLDVSDTGAAIPAVIADRLLRERVPSENGLGVGLFQSARLASSGGYRLNLVENRQGCVRFRLEPAG